MSSPQRFEVEQTTDGIPLSDYVLSGEYAEPAIDVTDMPMARILLDNSHGQIGAATTDGKKVLIRRLGEKAFPGIVETQDDSETNEDGALVELTLVHEAYRKAQNARCHNYVFDEDDDPLTNRDAVLVEPWKPFIFRRTGGTLDENGLPAAVDGVRHDQWVKMLIGTLFVSQQDLRDDRFFLPSQTAASTAKLGVYIDGEAGDERPALQRLRNAGGTFGASGSLESIPLESGSPSIRAMGDISTVTVLLIGEKASTDDPTLEICRNARDGTRTYTSVSLTHTANYNGSGLDAWTGTVDLSSDGASNKNSYGYKITIPGSAGDTETTKIRYVKSLATTVSNTGLGEGSIATYSNPTAFTDGSEDWIAGDFTDDSVLVALKKVRAMTEADSGTNRLPHWDIWLDSDLNVNMAERRGTDKTTPEFRLDNNHLTTIRHERYGGEVAYKAYGLGAGQGSSQLRTAESLSATAFTSGGLYIAANDPGGTATYGDLARVVVWRNANQRSPGGLLRETRAYLRSLSVPREYVKATLADNPIPLHTTGDGVKLVNTRTRTNAILTLTKISRSWDDGTVESITAELGEPEDREPELLRSIAGEANDSHARIQPAPATTPLSGPGVHFDKDNYGVFAFPIPDGSVVERVFLEMETQAWQSFERSALGGNVRVPSSERIEVFPEGNRIITSDDRQSLSQRQPHFLAAPIAAPPTGSAYRGGAGSFHFLQGGQGATSTTATYRMALIASSLSSPVSPLKDHSGNARTLSETATAAGDSPVYHALHSKHGWGMGHRQADSGVSHSLADGEFEGDMCVTFVGVTPSSFGSVFRMFDFGNKASLELDSTGKWQYNHGSSTTLTSGTTASTDTLYEVTLRRDATAKTVVVYANGVKVIDASYTEAIPTGAGDYRIGTIASPNYWEIVYQWRIWDQLVSQASLDSAVDGGRFDLEGNEHAAYFFDRAFEPSEYSILDVVEVELTEGEAHTLSKEFTSAQAQSTWSIVGVIAGVNISTVDADRDDIGSSGTVTGGDSGLLRVAEYTTGEHTHGLDQGIYTYDGDSGDGTGDPVFGKDFAWGVDVAVDSFGVPSDWANDKHPLTWGLAVRPQRIRADITNWLSVDANGVIASGIHRAYFLGAAASGNAKGLAKVSVTPIIQVKKQTEGES